MNKLIVIKNNSGERIDKFLMKEVFFGMEITRGEIICNIKDENVLVNEKKIKPSYILKEKDVISLNLKLKAKSQKLIPNAKINFEVVFEDKNFIVINKPVGLQVHPSEKNEPDTLVSGLIYKFPEIINIGDSPENRPGIVHRLDKDTSGIMLIVRNQKTFLELKNKFKNREIQKTYWAFVHGTLQEKKGIIEKSIARSHNYKKQVIASEKTKTKIRSAVTEYEVLKEFEDFSLLKVLPKTGRMHQIRIHLSSIGHPIVGDEKYKLKNTKNDENIKHHLLHAKKIKFNLDGKDFEFEVELPGEFKNCLALLTKKIDVLN